jgi:hypothetical protein
MALGRRAGVDLQELAPNHPGMKASRSHGEAGACSDVAAAFDRSQDRDETKTHGNVDRLWHNDIDLIK